VKHPCSNIFVLAIMRQILQIRNMLLFDPLSVPEPTKEDLRMISEPFPTSVEGVDASTNLPESLGQTMIMSLFKESHMPCVDGPSSYIGRDVEGVQTIASLGEGASEGHPGIGGGTQSCLKFFKSLMENTATTRNE